MLTSLCFLFVGLVVTGAAVFDTADMLPRGEHVGRLRSVTPGRILTTGFFGFVGSLFTLAALLTFGTL